MLKNSIFATRSNFCMLFREIIYDLEGHLQVVCFRGHKVVQLFKNKFSQNTTNLLSVINVATRFDSLSHHQANH